MLITESTRPKTICPKLSKGKEQGLVRCLGEICPNYRFLSKFPIMRDFGKRPNVYYCGDPVYYCSSSGKPTYDELLAQFQNYHKIHPCHDPEDVFEVRPI